MGLVLDVQYILEMVVILIIGNNKLMEILVEIYGNSVVQRRCVKNKWQIYIKTCPAQVNLQTGCSSTLLDRQANLQFFASS